MTVVAAIARGGAIVFAADTLTDYSGTLIDGAVKVRRIDVGGVPGLLAASGDGGILSVAARNLKLSAPPAGDTQEWADAAATAVSEVMDGQTPSLVDERRIDGTFLLGVGGQLYYLFTHQAVRIPDGVAALGPGCDTALGAMHSALSFGAGPEEAVLGAVALGCRFAEGCAVGPGGPTVLRLDPSTAA